MSKINSLRIKINALFSRSFVRSVTTVATGTAASQAITLAFAPFITRLYGPETYGLQGIYFSIAGLLATLAALSYPTAIVLPHSDSEALKIGKISIFVGISTTAIATILLTLFGNELLSLLKAEAIAPYTFLIPVTMIISVFGAVLGQWLIRKKAFSITATYGVANTAITTGIKLVAGLINPSALMLISAHLFGSLSGTILTYWGSRQSINMVQHSPQTGESFQTAWKIAKEHRDFPIFRTPQNLLNGFSQSLPLLILASFFGPGSAGQYAIAIAVLGVPSGLLGSSVMTVFYPKITQSIKNDENSKEFIIKATIGMALTGLIPFLTILAAGPIMFTFAFGEDWQTAGIYAQLLSVWLFFQFINKPAVAAIPALKLQGGLLIYELLSTASKVIALWIGFALFKSDVAAIAIFALFGAAAYAWLIIWVIHRSTNTTK